MYLKSKSFINSWKHRIVSTEYKLCAWSLCQMWCYWETGQKNTNVFPWLAMCPMNTRLASRLMNLIFGEISRKRARRRQCVAIISNMWYLCNFWPPPNSFLDFATSLLLDFSFSLWFDISKVLIFLKSVLLFS